MKKIGLYFGTFNPFHVGHLIIANHIAENTDLNEVWVVITPKSPFKKNKNLLDNHQRYELVYRAIENIPKLRASKIEFDILQPNYTVKTLHLLKEKYPNHLFSLIMGLDNLITLPKWRNSDWIAENHEIYVYPRTGYQKPMLLPSNTRFMSDVPEMNISSSHIRSQIRKGKNVSALLPYPTWKYLDEMNLYKDSNSQHNSK